MDTPPQGSSFGDPPGAPPSRPTEPHFGAPQQPSGPGPYRQSPGLEPNRGALVLTLGILGIVASLVGGLCCLPSGILALGFAVPAILMARADMKKYAAGTMDPTGYSATQAGFICGIIGVVVAALEALGIILLLIFYGSIFSFAILDAAM